VPKFEKQMKCPICDQKLVIEKFSPHGLSWAYCPPWDYSHALVESRFRIVAVILLFWDCLIHRKYHVEHLARRANKLLEE
jgi:hypothetical protein